jgi:hypothetical protein
MSTKSNIIIEQGATFSQDVALTDKYGQPIDVLGMTGDARMKRDYESLTAVEFNLALEDGICTFSMSATDTALLDPGTYVYDVTLTQDDGTVFRLVEGLATVTPSV